MQWLIANMWMALAAATFLGLLFGFSFRGLMIGSRIRKAQVEREIARTELTQTKAEVEALYAAQRKRKEESAQAVGGDDTLQTELEERESRISELGSQLAAARDELEGLKSAGNGDLAETTEPAPSDPEELTQLRDRNVWLEERVATLESDMSAAASDAPAPAAAPTESASSDTQTQKLAWQATYLRQRVDALEDKLLAQAAAPADAAPAAPVAEAPAANDEAAGEADEELARLRWRNRYLEGRLAYYEEGEAAADEPVADEPAAEPAVADEPAAAAEADPEPAAEPEADTAAEPAAEEVHPSEAMLAELEGVQPEQIEQPESGGDDLTAITGIGPRIGEVLNELGIWTYAQIAAWTPDNETWIENHLSFKGRVSRENWVEQAKSLIA